MAFKSMVEHNEERFKGLFLLQNDGDYADVVFMYSGVNDVMVADGVHYILSSDYTGYVHCCGSGCPACARNIRLQTRLFIPLYIVASSATTCTPGDVAFFDRSTRFEAQLQQDVFSKYPDPSQIIFRITRNGAAGSMDTRYSIVAKGRNPKTLAEILSATGTVFPAKYDEICKEVSASVLGTWLSSPSSVGDNNAGSNFDMYNIPDYQITPRGSIGESPAENPTVPVANPSVDSTASSSEVGSPVVEASSSPTVEVPSSSATSPANSIESDPNKPVVDLPDEVHF